MAELIWALAIIIVAISTYLIVLFVRVVRAEKRSFREIETLKPNLRTIVMVMGAEAYVDGPSPELRARLTTALEIYELLKPQKIYLYGGVGLVDEAICMKNFLQEAGLPERIMKADSMGHNTRASFERFTSENVPREVDQLIVVSSGYHSFRLVSQAKKLGYKLKAISPRNSPENQNKNVRKLRLVSEVFAILWYKIPTSLTNRIDTGPRSFRHRIPNFFISRIRTKNLGIHKKESVR